MIALAISIIFGIAVFRFFPFFPVSVTTLCLGIVSFLFVRGLKQKAWLAICVTAFGIFYCFMRQENFPEIKLSDKEVSVEGRINNVPELLNGNLRFTVDQVSIDGKEIAGKVRLTLSAEQTVNRDFNAVSGKIINAVAKLRKPGVLHNPGLYSYDIKRDGIVAIGYIREIQVTGGSGSLWSWIQNKRNLLGILFDNSLSAENAVLNKAIILGLTGGINQEMRDAFSATGLAHILSISGTHFGLLAFMIFKLIKMLVKYLPESLFKRMTLHITPSQIAVLLTLPVLVFYALLSGMSTPAVRSLIMIFIYMLAIFLGRRDQWLNSLSIAAVIILLYNPAALFDLSFQLSFIAVLSIGYVAERGKREREREGGVVSRGQDKEKEHLVKRMFNKTKTAIFMTLAAVLGTAPVVALAFKQFPLISPITNLIITPFICFVILPLGFFASFSALIFHMPSIPFNGLIDMLTHFALQLINIFAQIPYSNLHVHNPSFVIIVLYYLSLIFLIKGKSRLRFLPVILVICFYLIIPYSTNKSFRITFLDVGQGDSSVIEFPDGKVMLIDGGTYEPDTGRGVAAPYLWGNGIRSVDYLVASHLHPDHYGGLIYIMDNFKVGEIWLNSMIPTEAENFFKKMYERKIPHRVLKRGDVLEAERYKVYVLHPYSEFTADSPRGDFSDQNSGSLVLKIEFSNASILFTGDIEREAEESLLPLETWLKSDVIKVPHHGGRTSSSPDFLKAVNPQTAIISSGKNNIYKHPHDETLERYIDAGVRIYRTDADGAVMVIPQNESYAVGTYWDTEFKRVLTWQDEVKNLRLLFTRRF